MNQIRTLLQLAGRRIETTRFLREAHLVAVALTILALVLVAVERAGSSLFVPWVWVLPVLCVIGAGVALALWARGRRDELQVALEVDERLNLREKISTALHCRGREDTFAQAAIEDAVRTAGDARTRELVRRRFSIEPPPRWWLSPLILFAVILVSFVDPLDLFAPDEVDPLDPDVIQASDAAQSSVKAVIRTIEENPELQAELTDVLGQLTDQPIDPRAGHDAREIKRETIKDLSDLNRRLEEILDGEKGKTGAALERALKQLRSPEGGAAKELADAMAAGDFKGAKDALQNLLEQAQKGQLDPEQQKKLAEQLQDLADQLEKLAQQQKDLEDALKQAGLDPQLAKNPQALQQALQNNQNLNQQQIQQIQQAAQAQQAAQQMCQGLGGACGKMAQGLAQGQMGQLGQGGQQMANQLNQIEQLQQMLQQAQAAANACQGQCEGMGMALNQAIQQWMQQQGGGMGNWGQGRGGKAPLSPTPWKSKLQKAEVHTTAGEIIGQTKVRGPQRVGESKKTVQQRLAEISDGFDEALEEDRLPRKYHEAQKHYFGELEKQVRETGAPPAPDEEESSDGETEPAPAEDESGD